MIVLPSRRTRFAAVPFLFRASDCLDEQGLFALGYGQRLAATFARASRKRVVDQRGRVYAVPNGDVALDGDLGHSLLIEPARSNPCLRSEDFGTGWTLVGTGVRTPAVHSASGVLLDLLSDTDNTASSAWIQTVALTGDGDKAFSFVVKAASSGQCVVKLRAVGIADRGRVEISFSNGVPTVIATTGALRRVIPLADGSYRVLATATGVIASETNSIQFYPAGDANVALTGSMLAGGVQVENAAVSSSYMPSAASAGTRVADSLFFPWNVAPGAMTVYVRGREHGTRLEPGAYVWQISQSNNNPRFHLNRTVGTARMQLQTVSSGGAFSTVSAPLAGDANVGDLVEFRSTLGADGSLLHGTSLNGGAELVSSRVTGTALEPAWSGRRLWIGSSGAGAAGLFAFTHLVIAPGEQSLDAMRELAGL